MKTTDHMIAEKVAFSLFSADGGELTTNPFPLFAQLRSVGPIVPIPIPLEGTDRQGWMVTQMKEAVQILKDHTHFTVDPRSISGNVPLKHSISGNNGESDSSTFFTGNSMLSVDEPDHRRLRGLVSKVFTPRFIEGLRPRMQEIADELLDQVQERGEMDLIKDYAFPLPINVISEMLGVPQADRAQIRIWSNALAHGQGLGKQDESVKEHMRAFGEYTSQLVAEKRLHPADDLISQMVAIEEAGDRLSEEELLSMITLLIFAGHETTSNLIGTGTLMLLDHPDQLKKLKADPSLVPSAVEELLRFNGPATIVGPRFAMRDIEIAGQQIKMGDMLLVIPTSANRDETQFSDPEELDIARNVNRHLAFGHGIHVCLGKPLARLEGEIAFATLFKRMPNLRLSVPRERITWSFSLNSRSLTALPVAF